MFTTRKWLQRFWQFTEKEQKRDITPLIKGEDITATKWTGKNNLSRKISSGEWDPKRCTKSPVLSIKRTGQFQKLILDLLFTEYYLPKRTYHKCGDFFRAKQTKEEKKESPEEFWRRLNEIEKESSFSTISAEELLISKYMTEITDKTLPDKMLEERL